MSVPSLESGGAGKSRSLPSSADPHIGVRNPRLSPMSDTPSEARETPRVSVVMPVYNAAAFLEEAVESVLAQTYPNWELLLIDDGSTDGSRALAERYAAEHPERIRCLQHPGRENRGASATRNLGIANARGEYLAFFDADDVWLPQKLDEQVSLLDTRSDVGMVYGSAFWWYSWTGKETDRRREFLDVPRLPDGTVVSAPELLVACWRERTSIPLLTTALLRREAVEHVGGFEDEFRVVFTDQVFFTKLFLATAVLPVHTNWAKYRRHPASSVARTTREGKVGTFEVTYLRWAERYLAENGWRGTPAWKALQVRVWKHRHPRIANAVRHVKHVLSKVSAA